MKLRSFSQSVDDFQGVGGEIKTELKAFLASFFHQLITDFEDYTKQPVRVFRVSNEIIAKLNWREIGKGRENLSSSNSTSRL